MNKQGKKQIEKWIDTLTNMKEDIESMQEEEQDKFDNLPEGIQESERCEAIQESADNLENAASSIDDAISELQEIIDR